MSHSESTSIQPDTAKGSLRRYYRLKSVIEYISTESVFALSDAKQALNDERPGFITKLVHDLEKSGWVVREDSDSNLFRWNSGRGNFSCEQWLDEKVYGNQVKVAPAEQRPRERLLAQGVSSLSHSELVAILIRSGRPGESAVEAGEKIAKKFQARMEQLPDAGRAELAAISPAVQATAYCQIMAGIELGRRIALLSATRTFDKISSTMQAMEYCRHRFARLANDAKQEEFHIVTLDTKNQVIGNHRITVGTLDASLVHPREVFRAAIRDAASSIILVHNHPSGDPAPSREDFSVTRRLEQCGETLGIRILDHIIVGSQGTASIRESGG